MGLNLDLNQMMNLPMSVCCPNCKTDLYNRADDFDIDTPDCNPERGVWIDELECDCGAILKITYKLTADTRVEIE
ncbi:hypothetical protein [Methanospirillum sp.]